MSLLQPAYALRLPGTRARGSVIAAGRVLAAAEGSGVATLAHSAAEAAGIQHTPLALASRTPQQITTLAYGCLSATHTAVLAVATAQSIHVHDLAASVDVFSRAAPDGCAALAVGSLGGPSLVFAGGQGTIYGYDAQGRDVFWTVTPECVTSLAVLPVTNSAGQNELLVGCRDCALRVYNSNADTLYEFTQLKSATHLRHLDRRKFAFVLADGTHGVCDGTAVLWTRRTARERRVTCISGFDADDSGSAQLALGYSDGTVEVLDTATGEVLCADPVSSSSPIVGLETADFRNEGKTSLLVVSANGDLRGYHGDLDLEDDDAWATSPNAVAPAFASSGAASPDMFCIGQGPAGTGASSPSSQLPSHSKLAGDSISTPTSPHTPQAASPELRPLLLQLSDFHQLKQHLSAEVADQSNIIRHLALRAEDYRLMADYTNMLDVYRELHSANTELLSTAAARTTAHKALQSHLRQVGDLIEQAAAEKDSAAKASFTEACRQAVATNDADELVKLLNMQD